MRKQWEEALKRWLLGFALAAGMCSALAQQRLTLNFVNTEIEAVARAMADFTGRPFIVDPRVKGTVSLTIVARAKSFSISLASRKPLMRRRPFRPRCRGAAAPGRRPHGR